MGSPNFGISPFVTLGYDARYYPEDEDIQYYRNDILSAEENDPASIDYVSDDTVREWMWESEADYIRDLYDDTEYLVEQMNYHLQKTANPLCDWQFTPFIFEVNNGYNDNSFRVEIKSEYFADPNNSAEAWFAYEKSKDWNELPSSMTFEQFDNVCNKLQEYAQYMLRELAKYTTPLTGIGGDWCGSSYDMPENTAEEHKRFGKLFNTFLEELRTTCQSKLFGRTFTAWSF